MIRNFVPIANLKITKDEGINSLLKQKAWYLNF